jgi:hypothetical protein
VRRLRAEVSSTRSIGPLSFIAPFQATNPNVNRSIELVKRTKT